MKLVEKKVCTYSWKCIFSCFSSALVQGMNFVTVKSSRMGGSLDKLAGYKGS